MSAAAWQMHIPGLCCFFKRNTDLFAIMSPFSYSGPCAVFALYHCFMNNAEKCSFSSCFQSKEKALNGEKRGEERDQSRNGTKGEAKWRGKRTEMFQPGSDFGICRKSYWVTGGGGCCVCIYKCVCVLGAGKCSSEWCNRWGRSCADINVSRCCYSTQQNELAALVLIQTPPFHFLSLCASHPPLWLGNLVVLL